MCNENIIEKIRKMQMMTVANGCTPNEAAGFAEKVQELMAQHSISMFDVESKRFAEDIVVEKVLYTNGKRTEEWHWTLASVLAEAYSCKLIKEGQYFKFLGFTSDSKISAYMYATLADRLHDMSLRDVRKYKIKGFANYHWRNTYISSACVAIHVRLKPNKEKVYAGSTGYALVVTKEQQVAQKFEEYFPNVKKATPSKTRQRDYRATTEGYAAGQKIELRSAIEGQTAQKELSYA